VVGVTDLAEFGGGIDPDPNAGPSDDGDTTDTARHRRQQYTLGRCRAITTGQDNPGQRCAGGIADDVDGPFCSYHKHAHEPVTIDDRAGELVRWCGTETSPFDDLPEPCREALKTVDPVEIPPDELDETHVDRDGLWIPPALREFTSQVVIRTPRATMQHFGSGPLAPYYGMVDESHFGDPEEMFSAQNPDLAPDRVTIKRQGENAVTLDVEVETDG
jgi:hypothetical protein